MKTMPSPTGRFGATTVWLPWAVGFIAALFMLSLFVDALHASVERGEALRRAQGFADVRGALAQPMLRTEKVASSRP